MLQKFDSRVHLKDFTHLPFSYYSSEVMLDFEAYVFERNGENILVWQDALYPHDFPSIFIPQKKENWEKMTVFAATQPDVDAVKMEQLEIIIEKPVTTEFFYTTAQFIHPEGSFKKQLDHFIAHNTYLVRYEYSKEKIREFYQFWLRQRDRNSYTIGQEVAMFEFCLAHLDTYGIRQCYVEVEGRLVGFAWGMPHWKEGWVSLQLKCDYAYRGLEKLLRHEYVKLFSEFEIFTTGGGTPEVGIEQHKKGMKPYEERQYWYLFTGDHN